MTNNFNEGDRVYSQTGRAGGYKIYTVTKVHKTGNFVIDGGKQQYRQNGYGCGENYLHVRPLTDEVEARLKATKEAAERHAAFRLLADKLGRMNWTTPISEDQLERMLALAIELKVVEVPKK